MIVLSLFDGISCGRVALERAGISVSKYYASEIDRYASQISMHNFPDIIRLGDVTKWMDWDINWSRVDLVTAGFPCQSWSMAGQQLGDKDERGALFWTTLDVIRNTLKNNPNAKFLMENVRMKKEFEDYITYHTEVALGRVEKILINSALVSAQNRNRFYWTNFNVSQPKDKEILLKDVVEGCFGVFQIPRGKNKGGVSRNYDKSPTVTSSSWELNNFAVVGGAIRGRYTVNGTRQDHKMSTAGLTKQRLELRSDNKTNTLTTVQKDNVLVLKGDRNIARSIKETNDESVAIKQLECGMIQRLRPCDIIKSPCKGGHVANAIDINGNESIKRVYSINGKSPTLTTMAGGHREPKILVDRDKSHCIDANYFKGGNIKNYIKKGRRQLVFGSAGSVFFYRKLTPIECERLQTLPDNYTLVVDGNNRQVVSDSQRYKAIGNGWTVDVIAHILKCAFIDGYVGDVEPKQLRLI